MTFCESNFLGLMPSRPTICYKSRTARRAGNLGLTGTYATFASPWPLRARRCSVEKGRRQSRTADRTRRLAPWVSIKQVAKLPRIPQLQGLSCPMRFHLQVQSPGDPQLAQAGLYSGDWGGGGGCWGRSPGPDTVPPSPSATQESCNPKE